MRSATRRGAETVLADSHRIGWARLLKRVLAARCLEYKLVCAEACALDIDTQHFPNRGGGELKIIAAILERPVVESILTHLG